MSEEENAKIKKMVEGDFDFTEVDKGIVYRCKHGYDKRIPCDLCKEEGEDTRA